MHSFRPPVATLTLLVALALVLTGCGDGATTATEPEPTPTTSEPEASTAAPTPTPTPTPTPETSTETPAGGEDVIPDALARDLVVAGEAWLRLARGERGAGLPVDTPVEVYLGGERAQEIDPAGVDDPQVWADLCDPAGKGYAERACPLSALLYFEQPGVEFSTEPAREPCSKPNRPADLRAYQRVTLIAAGQRSCLDYAAVELYVNDVAQLVAVNLVLGSP